MSSMDESIAVDGARVAAAILERLPSDTRDELVESIRVINPESALKIEAIMLSAALPAPVKREVVPPIASLTELSDQDVQRLLREVTPHDLAISLKTAPVEAKEKILDNLSEARQKQLLAEFSELPPMHPEDVEAAQNRVMRKLSDIYPEQDTPSEPRRLRSRLA
jgi:flagellar motor switch protein FliG